MLTVELEKEKLLERLKYSMTKSEVIQLAEIFNRMGVSYEEILQLTNHSDRAISFHSAWILENMLLSNPLALDYYLTELVGNLMNNSNESVKRHLAKLIVHGIHRVLKRVVLKVLEKEFWALNLEPLEEVCFKWFVDNNSKPAVKVHCLEILYLLSHRQRWIAEELPQIIENHMEHGSPALRAKGKEILARLREGRA